MTFMNSSNLLIINIGMPCLPPWSNLFPIFKTILPDLIIFCVKGAEEKCGDIKPPEKRSELVDVNKCG